MSLYDELIKVIENDGFLFIVFEGDKGFGKSNAMLDFMYNIISRFTGKEDCWNEVIRHVIFTIDDFWNIDRRDDLVRDKLNRAIVVGWDDFAMHTSGYAFLRGEGAKIGEFIEDFEAVRELCSILIVTVATYGLIPPGLREKGQVHIRIKMKGRGYGWVYRKEDDERDLDKWYWRKIAEIEFDKVPSDVYAKYRELKRKAEKVRKQMILLRKLEKAKDLAEELTEEDWNDEIKLIALGIKDIHGNWTDFGLKVKEVWDKLQGEGLDEESDFVLLVSKYEKEFEEKISSDLIVLALNSFGVKVDKAKIRNIRKAMNRLYAFALAHRRKSKIPLSEWYKFINA